MASLTHHALLRPEHLYRRIGPADELIRDGFRGSNGVLALVELVWRTVGLYELGDPSAELGLAMSGSGRTPGSGDRGLHRVVYGCHEHDQGGPARRCEGSDRGMPQARARGGRHRPSPRARRRAAGSGPPARPRRVATNTTTRPGWVDRVRGEEAPVNDCQLPECVVGGQTLTVIGS
jgi:hypothetical protein